MQSKLNFSKWFKVTCFSSHYGTLKIVMEMKSGFSAEHQAASWNSYNHVTVPLEPSYLSNFVLEHLCQETRLSDYYSYICATPNVKRKYK